MRRLSRWTGWAALSALLLVLAACLPGNNGGGWGVAGSQGSTSIHDVHARGGIVVGIFPDIAPAMHALVPVWERTHPGVPIVFSIAPTINIVINQNTYIPQDVLISDSEEAQSDALSQGLIHDKGAIFAAATLDFAMPASNPGAITSLAEVARPGLNLVHVTWNTGLSEHTQTALERMMRLPQFAPGTIPCTSSYAACVYGNLTVTVSDGISAGHALVDNTLLNAPIASHQTPFDGAFIYHTDTLAVESTSGAGALKVIPVPTAYAPPIPFWCALSTFQAANPATARMFQQFLLSPAAQSVLAAQGYLPPSAAAQSSPSAGA